MNNIVLSALPNELRLETSGNPKHPAAKYSEYASDWRKLQELEVTFRANLLLEHSNVKPSGHLAVMLRGGIADSLSHGGLPGSPWLHFPLCT